MRMLRTSLMMSVLALLVGSAHADIYGYLDKDGIAHFSTQKLDARYHLFALGDVPFDSNQATAAGAAPGLSRYLTTHPNIKKFEPLVNQAANDYGLHPAFMKAIMAAESGFNPNAVSPKGAIGLMQIMPDTAARFGLQGDVKRKLTDPKTNIRLSARYLRDLFQMFPGRPDLVIASYNAGEGAVQKYGNTIPPYTETRNYVQLVSKFYQFYYQPNQATEAEPQAVAGLGLPRAPTRVRMFIPARSNMPPSLN